MSRRNQLIFLNVTIIVLCIHFLYSGYHRLNASDTRWLLWGYSCSFIFVMGSIDIAIALGLLLKPLRQLGALLLIFAAVLQGYVYLTHDAFFFVMVHTAMGGFAFMIIWFSRKELYQQLE